jgi:hypothetical protein
MEKFAIAIAGGDLYAQNLGIDRLSGLLNSSQHRAGGIPPTRSSPALRVKKQAKQATSPVYYSVNAALCAAIRPASRALEILSQAPVTGADLALLPGFGCAGAFEVHVLCHSGQQAPSPSQKRRAKRVFNFWRGAGLDMQCIRFFHETGLDHE